MFRRSSFSLPIAALLTLATGFAGTATLYATLNRMERDSEAMDFQQRATVRFANVKQGMNDAVAGLEILNQFFVTVDNVSLDQFRLFTAPLLVNYPYVQAFGFQRMVSSAERTEFEAEMRKTFPNFSITDFSDGRQVISPTRDSYRVVNYVEPLQKNKLVLGFDAASNSLQDDAIKRANLTGLPSATNLIRLVQETGTQRGFLVIMPVYQHTSFNEVESRRRAVIGYTNVVFRAGDLIETILNMHGLLDTPNVHFSVYAGKSPDSTSLAFERKNAPLYQGHSLLPQLQFDIAPKITSHTFEVAGKPWHMTVSETRSSNAGYSGSTYVLIGGVLFSLLAAAYVQTIVSRSKRVQGMIDESMEEARRANQLLTQDIETRKRTEKALQLRERAIEASSNAIIITSAAGPGYPIEYVNSAFVRMTGYSSEDVLGKSMRLLIKDDRDQPGVAEFKAATIEKREGHAIIRSYRKDGTLFWNDLYVAPVRDVSGETTHFIAVQSDITAMKRYEADLEFQANQDPLTGLANRNLLRDRLSQALAYADRYGHTLWVVFVDLDRFKFINDTLGRDAGDALLKAVAERLRSTIREADTLARIGGDEFVLILPETADERLATGAIQRIMDTISRPLKIDEHEFFLTCSIGIAVYPTDGADSETLVKHADIAMYRAKETGRNNSQFYTPVMNERALERLRIEGDLRNALVRQEFILHYQPQVDLRTGRIIGMEALIRWQHPVFGMVSPIRFIGLAEETGLIVPIGAWVIRTACAQSKAWQRAGFGNLRIAVNLSARQFAQQNLAQSIADVLKETELDPRYLEIELTESLLMTDVERAVSVLRDLNELGVQLSIDDFGTGYSSLSYLKRFPIDVLKIDQSFVRDITLDPDDAAIVELIISLAHSLNLQVIAEGVETQEQLTFLRDHRCNEIQGYYFSRPVPADEFRQMLEQDKRLPPEFCSDV